VVDVVQVTATLAAMVVVIGGGAGAVVWIRKWIAGVATSARQAATQLATSNGHTIGQYVEQTAEQMAQLRTEIGKLTGLAGDNRSAAQEAKATSVTALALAQRANDRVDHLLTTLATGDRLNSARGGPV
jgi:hypothetical protein